MWLICVCKFVIALSNFVITFLAFFLVSKKGFTTGTAGLAVTVVALAYIPATLVGGRISYGNARKKLVALFVAGGALYLCVPLFQSLTVLQLALIFAGRTAITLTEPIFNNAINLLSDSTARKKDAFSRVYLFVNLGFALGPLLAGRLYNHHLNAVFIIDGACKLLVALLIFVAYVPLESCTEAERNPESGTGGYRSLVSAFRPLIAFTVVAAILEFVYAQHDFTLAVSFSGAFATKGPVLYGYVMSVNAVVVIASTALLNRITRAVDANVVVLVSSLFFAVGFAGYAGARSLPGIVACTVLWTVGEILFYTNMAVCVHEIVGESRFGLAYSFVNAMSRIGVVASPVVMGLVLEGMSSRSAWLLIGGVSLMASALTATFLRLPRKGLVHGGEQAELR